MNPHTRYELSLDKVPQGFALAFVILTCAAILGTIYLYSITPGEVLPMPQRTVKLPHIPDAHAVIQQAVDAHNPILRMVSK